MIKFYCDKCGKEIAENVNKEVEETEAIDLHGAVLAKWAKILHYCDECQYQDLTCDFKVGDSVITDDGRYGVIESICDCENCKKRGFYEPRVKMKIGADQIWITDTDKRNGFANFYKIGDQVFGNVDKEFVKDQIQSCMQFIREQNEKLVELKMQLDIVNKLK